MALFDERICDACGMPYDWIGVTLDEVEYCCRGCARGEPCDCLQHNHGLESGLRWSDEEAPAATGLHVV